MKANNTIKEDIKEMLELASAESGISYMDLLEDLTTIQDITSIFNITSSQAIELTNELLKEHTTITIKSNIKTILELKLNYNSKDTETVKDIIIRETQSIMTQMKTAPYNKKSIGYLNNLISDFKKVCTNYEIK